MLETDGKYCPMFPHESRIRNLTYSTEIFADIEFSQKELDDQYEENPVTQQREKKVKAILKSYKKEKVAIGKVPVMLRSKFCQLKKFNEMQRVKNGKDCSYDQGGYFIINGSEKVIVAQERMGNNQVNVFNKKPPSKYSWVAEIRSQADVSNRPPQLFTMQMKASQRHKHANSSAPGPRESKSIYCTIPMIRESIPLVILFRALNCTTDKNIL
jgi:DNA-directed RNA polymerase II subunit RPB2